MTPSADKSRRPAAGGVQLNRKTSAACVALATGAILAVAWWIGLREPDTTISPEDDLARERGTNLSPAGGTLAISIGDRWPRWRVAGWLNGSPPSEPELTGKVIVADIWNDL